MKGQSDLRGGRDGKPKEFISKTNIELMRKVRSPRVEKEEFVPFDQPYGFEDAVGNTENWNLSHFRPYFAHNPDDVMVGRQLTEVNSNLSTDETE